MTELTGGEPKGSKKRKGHVSLLSVVSRSPLLLVIFLDQAKLQVTVTNEEEWASCLEADPLLVSRIVTTTTATAK